MKNILIFKGAVSFVSYDIYAVAVNAIDNLSHNLLGFVSMNPKEYGDAFLSSTVLPLNSVSTVSFDLLLIPFWGDMFPSACKQISEYSGVEERKIKPIFWLLQEEMKRKYEYIQDPVIQETLKYWKDHELSVYNQHLSNKTDTYNEVYFDKNCGLPYILFETIEGKEKRMYFPKDESFHIINEKFYKKNILSEQSECSPHLYTTKTHNVMDGDTVVDAGVCEGNFSLRYVDVAEKIYLFEPDSRWSKPLYYTFKDYTEKVFFFPKAVGAESKNNTVRLDDVLNPKASKIFLKMDIEGAEPYALKGAKNLMQKMGTRCSVCCYHNANDNIKIKACLDGYGYRSVYTGGYIVFIWGKDIWDVKDFRKGVIHGELM